MLHQASWLNVIAKHENICHTLGDELESILSESSMWMICVTSAAKEK